eukprot:INCI1200.1.p1 GENE.INCI1200.1~~INCI1200.1.p1  ORF type:complete len:222 (-),score=33.21 INCI1200.1:38-703(-)
MATNLCALALVPPERLWPPLQELRLEHDKNANRWPPHINVAFPFLAPHALAAALPRLRQALAEIPSFTICFERFAWLEPPDKKKGNSRVWHYLEPNTAAKASIAKLTEVVYRCCNQSLGEPRPLPAHMSIGQSTLKDARAFSAKLNRAYDAMAVSFRESYPDEEAKALACGTNAGQNKKNCKKSNNSESHRAKLKFRVSELCVMARKPNGNGKIVSRLRLQ